MEVVTLSSLPTREDTGSSFSVLCNVLSSLLYCVYPKVTSNWTSWPALHSCNEQPELGGFHTMGGRTGQGQCQEQGLGPVGVAPQLVSQEDEVVRGVATPSDP